jgi:hypothetical protein
VRFSSQGHLARPVLRRSARPADPRTGSSINVSITISCNPLGEGRG